MDLGKKIPDYLLEKGNITKLILLTALFALIFINVYEPFGSRTWLPDMSNIKYFLLSSALVLIGMAVVAISRIIAYYRYGKKHGHHTLTLGYYLLWIACEIICMSFVFCLFEMICFSDERDIMTLMNIALRNTSFVLLIPYSVLWLYFSWVDKNNKLKAALAGGSPAGEAEPDIRQQMTNFYDSKGEVKFSVKINDLIYIKGADNYITIFYSDNAKLSSIMIRNSMKQVEEDLKQKGIVRCHRSYMVNTKHIKVFERQRDGFVVKLDTETPLLIPVSKSYVNDVFELFG